MIVNSYINNSKNALNELPCPNHERRTIFNVEKICTNTRCLESLKTSFFCTQCFEKHAKNDAKQHISLDFKEVFSHSLADEVHKLKYNKEPMTCFQNVQNIITQQIRAFQDQMIRNVATFREELRVFYEEKFSQEIFSKLRSDIDIFLRPNINEIENSASTRKKVIEHHLKIKKRLDSQKNAMDSNIKLLLQIKDDVQKQLVQFADNFSRSLKSLMPNALDLKSLPNNISAVNRNFIEIPKMESLIRTPNNRSLSRGRDVNDRSERLDTVPAYTSSTRMFTNLLPSPTQYQSIPQNSRKTRPTTSEGISANYTSLPSEDRGSRSSSSIRIIEENKVEMLKPKSKTLKIISVTEDSPVSSPINNRANVTRPSHTPVPSRNNRNTQVASGGERVFKRSGSLEHLFAYSYRP
jgi:hypothetical protein